MENTNYTKQGQPVYPNISHSENSVDRAETSKLIGDDELQNEFYGSDAKVRDGNATGKAVSTPIKCDDY